MRKTTLIHLDGDGERGTGEDVVYDAEDHDILQAKGDSIDLAGDWTIDSFSKRLEEVSVWPQEPARGDVSRDYRRWAFESAALDLALRQAGRSLADAVGREPRPLTLRGVDAAHRAPARSTRPSACSTCSRSTPAPASSSTRPTHWTQELVDELAAAGRGQLARLQELLQGHAGRPRHRHRPLPDVHRGVPRRLVRGCGRDRRDAPAARAGGGPAHLGRADPLRRGRARAALEAAHGQHQAVALRPAVAALRDVRLVRERGRRAPTAAARPSSASVAATSSTWPRSSTRTPRTTRRRAASTSPVLPDGLPSSPLEPRIDATGFRWA